jgi:hypothetical protein
MGDRIVLLISCEALATKEAFVELAFVGGFVKLPADTADMFPAVIVLLPTVLFVTILCDVIAGLPV